MVDPLTLALMSAAQDRDADVAALDELDDEQVGYLAVVAAEYDPVTAGLECAGDV